MLTELPPFYTKYISECVSQQTFNSYRGRCCFQVLFARLLALIASRHCVYYCR